MYLRVLQMREISVRPEDLLPTNELFCSVETEVMRRKKIIRVKMMGLHVIIIIMMRGI